VHIQPGNSGDCVQCSVTTHSLDQTPDFEALSYTWGDPARRRSILCNQKSLQVGYNLWEAFQHLRYPDRSRTMWIDAICINQADIVERGEQVQLMDKIYRQAASVIVWLGAASKNSSAAFRLIHQLHTIAEATSLEDRDKPLITAEIERSELPARYNADWEALDSIFWRAWFKRVWIIQEVVVARSAVVFCGGDSIHWDAFAVVADFISRRQLGSLTAVDPSTLIPILGVRNSYRNTEEMSLLTLLVSFRQSLATNPIDKVYALLNIASDVSIIPDYRVPMNDLFREVCTTYLQRSLDILSLNGDTAWKQQEGLPSWVPDWSSTLLEMSFLFSYGMLARLAFRADGNTSPHWRLAENGNKILIRGKLLGRVKTMGETLIFGNGNVLLRNLHMQDTGRKLAESTHWWILALVIRHWERLILRLKRYPTGEDIRAVLHKTLIANASLDIQSGSDPTDLARLYSLYRKQYAMPLKWPDIQVERDLVDIQVYGQAVLNAAYGRRIFVSRDGYVGLCPYSTRRGDCVVVFHGGKTAYILREKHTKASKSFKFVGEAYVHGFMDGEAFQSDSTYIDEKFGIV